MDAQVIQYLRDNGIDCLYHITSQKNWAAIREKGICALSLLEEQGLTPPEFGSDFLDREIRQRKGLVHYVSLSFSNSSPFLHRSQKAGFLKQYVVIKVSLDVLSSPESFIFDTNPVDETAQKGSTLEYLKSLRLDIAHSGTTARLEKHTDRRFVSAEVNIKGRIPVEYILNTKELDSITSEDTPSQYQLYLFIVDQSDTMKSPMVYKRVHFETCADVSVKIVNSGIDYILKPRRLSSRNEFNSYSPICEIGVLGYGASAIDWKGNGSDNAIMTADDLLLEQESLSEDDKDEHSWIESKSTGYHLPSLESAFIRAKQIAAQWLFRHPNSKAFVIHITNGRSVKKGPKSIEKAARELSSLTSLILFNFQITEHTDQEILFAGPNRLDDLDAYGSFLYRVSSESNRIAEDTEERAFAVNSSMASIISLLSDSTQ